MTRLVPRLYFFLSSVVACIVLPLSSTTSAQLINVTQSTSVPIPGEGHDYIKMLSETVDPASGSVSLRISMPVPPGRALALPFAFSYNSNGVHFPQAGPTNALWTSNIGLFAQGGWNYTLPVFSGVSYSYPASQGSGTCHDLKAFVFQDSNGGRNAFGGLRKAAGNSLYCHGPVLSDSSDYYSASLPGAAQGFAPTPATIADADGTVFNFTGQSSSYTGPAGPEGGTVVQTLATSLEDRNGNVITLTPVNQVVTATDTVGRSAWSFSGFGNTGDSVTVSGLGGLTP